MQDTEIPAKILKENTNFFCWTDNSSIQWRYLFIKIPWIFQIPQYKNCSRNPKDNYRPRSMLPISMLPLKYLKSSCARNFQIILVIDFQNYSVVFERDLVRNIVFLMRYKWMKAVDSIKFLVQVLLTYQKLLTAFVMIF